MKANSHPDQPLSQNLQPALPKTKTPQHSTRPTQISSAIRKLIFASSLIMSACTPGTLSGGFPPKPPSAAKAANDNPPDSPKNFDPPPVTDYLIIDWKDTEIKELSKFIKQQIVIVAMTGETTSYLTDCSINKNKHYSYIGNPTDGDHINIKNASELGASFPGYAKTLADIDAEFNNGTSLVFEYKTAGSYKGPDFVSRHSLVGDDCSRATHYVKEVFIGAFAITKASNTALKAGANVLGAGMHGGDSSEKKRERFMGKLESCKAAKKNSKQIVDDCSTPVKVILGKLSEQAPPLTVTPEAKQDISEEVMDTTPITPTPTSTQTTTILPPIPSETTFKEAKCVSRTTSNEADCKSACNNGNMQSCTILGWMYVKQANPDLHQATRKFRQACDNNYANACSSLGVMYERGYGTTVNLDEAFKLYAQACENNSDRGCTHLGTRYQAQNQIENAIQSYQKAIDINGNNEARFRLGSLLALNENRLPEALSLFETACGNNYYGACISAGKMHYEGKGTNKNIDRGMELFAKACADPTVIQCLPVFVPNYVKAQEAKKDTPSQQSPTPNTPPANQPTTPETPKPTDKPVTTPPPQENKPKEKESTPDAGTPDASIDASAPDAPPQKDAAPKTD